MYTPAGAEHELRQALFLSWCEEVGEDDDSFLLLGRYMKPRVQTIRTAAELYRTIREYAAAHAVTVALEEDGCCVVLDRM